MPLEWLYVRSGWSRRSSAAASFVTIACFQDSLAARTSAFGSAALSDAAVANRRSHLSIGFQLNAVRQPGARYNFQMRFALVLFVLPLFAQTYDLVIANGRVLDPASNLDATRHIGIRDGKIAAVSSTPLTARAVIDAKGLVVTPGFIDLHSHGQTAENYRFKARDCVTTALELEAGVHPAAAWYAQREGRALINYGASSGELPARIAVMHDSGTLLPRDRAAEGPPAPDPASPSFRINRAPESLARSPPPPPARARSSSTCAIAGPRNRAS